MALRLHRVSDEEWQRLAATRRNQDLAPTPPRASINAIETELRSLAPANGFASD
ncbi:MAG: hypothetical protein QOE62_2167 [Actinomycetota bacterium]|jgi:hypothetical protein|nr:hypothetical protein [Actinomycetota bacterium]